MCIHVYVAQCSETNEKSIFRFMRFLVIEILAKHQPSAGFLSPSGRAAPSAGASEGKYLGCRRRPKFIFRRVMRIPDMSLVLKLDNGEVITTANEQTDRITQPYSTVLVYRWLILCSTFVVNWELERIFSEPDSETLTSDTR